MTSATRQAQKSYQVETEHAIHFMGSEVPPALSTPALLMWMELLSREVARPLLEPGQDTVGISIQLQHFAPTPVGMKVRIQSRLEAQEGKILNFQLEAFDEKDKISKATHRRAIVNVPKFGERLSQKASQT